MGAVGGLLGVAGGASGTGFAAPAAANITSPVQPGQVQTAYTGAQGSLSAQQALLQALQNQNGLANQSNVYNQLQGVVAGQGPNPAQAMLNQSTGQNVANQAALAAGQRGANANVGLIARQAAQAGTNAQQQAAGQAATLQANQSLGALGQAGNLATTQAGQQINQTQANNASQVAEQQALLQALQGYNQAQVGSQQSVNTGNTQLANTTMQGQQGLGGGLLNSAGAAAGFAQGGQAKEPAGGPQSSAAQFLANKFACGGSMDYGSGGNVAAQNPNQKAKVQGNSYANDKIPALLSEGEVVIPRDVVQSSDPVRNSAAFVQKVLAKRGKR